MKLKKLPKILFGLPILLLALGVVVHAQSLGEIEWLTEHYFPFNYKGVDGHPDGFSVEILLEMWKDIGLKKTRQQIKIVPWARGIKMLETNNRTCLFAMGINEKRKEKYQIVGNVYGGINALLSKKSKRYTFNNIGEINRVMPDFSIGVVNEDVSETTFLKIGGDERLLYRVPSGELLVRMLNLGRLELVAFGDLPFMDLAQKEGLAMPEYQIAYTMSEGRFGYAFNLNVDRTVIQKLQNAFDKLERSGKIREIKNKYFKKF